MDPIDHRNVYVGKSGIPGAGEGLFARRDILPGEIVVLYAGVYVGSYGELFSGRIMQNVKWLGQILLYILVWALDVSKQQLVD